MVLGSSRQRAVLAGADSLDAVGHLTDGLRALAPAAERRGVTILMEPLAPQLCNVVNTLAQAMTIVRAVNSPAVQTIFDTHNTAAKERPFELLDP